MIKKTLLATVIVALLGVGYYGYQRYANRQQSAANTTVTALSSDPIFNTRLPDLAGVSQPIAQWRGKVLVINFWATWCPPCRQEIPEFIQLQKQYGAQGLQFIGIALDEKAKIQSYVDEAGINYPVLVGDLEAVALSQTSGNRLGGLPYTVIIDRNGKIIATEVGGLTGPKLTAIVAPLLQNH
ncbi:MAG: TlpA disulfide reductase family protein [Sulfuriferula sp.]|nr:TlpA disulfide reductase family protein [Sulfuriferula sp.]